MLKILVRYLLGLFFVIAGFNHFLNPEFYFPLIPDYLPYPKGINSISGILEILLGMGIFWEKFSKMAAWGIVVLLILFTPSHIYFIQIGSCVEDGLCVPEWVAWIRLLVIHPILVFWAYIFTKNESYGK
jgi:uncharacterized membrane protein